MTGPQHRTRTERTQLYPFKEQEPFLQQDKTYYGYISGVGAGKTYAGVLRTAKNVHQWNPGEMGAIVAPTTTMIKDVILPVMREMGLLEVWDYKSAYSDEPGIHVPNGARILLLSADNQRTIERLAGLNLAWWWIDEAPRVEHRAVEILTQRLRVGEYRNGYMTGTPKGKNHTYDFFIDEENGENYQHGEADIHEHSWGDRLAIVRVPTHANPHTPEDYKEQVDRDHSGQVYEQEILGKFVDFKGLVYPWFSKQSPPEGHVVDEVEANINHYFYGVDWGFTNPSVVLAMGETTRGELAVLEEFADNRVTVEDLARVIHAMQERHRAGPIYCDPSEPASIETLQRTGLNAQPADNSVIPGIQHVTNISDRLLVREGCQELINEFGMYRYEDDDASEEPVKVNDHAMDALRYGLFTYAQQGGGHSDMIGADYI